MDELVIFREIVCRRTGRKSTIYHTLNLCNSHIFCDVTNIHQGTKRRVFARKPNLFSLSGHFRARICHCHFFFNNPETIFAQTQNL